jgi:hypothetical protein
VDLAAALPDDTSGIMTNAVRRELEGALRARVPGSVFDDFSAE